MAPHISWDDIQSVSIRRSGMEGLSASRSPQPRARPQSRPVAHPIGNIQEGQTDMEYVGIFFIVLGIPTIVAFVREAREKKRRLP